MTRAAIYVRVSTEKDEQKDSPEHQLAACKELCDQYGFDVVQVYEDRASGMSYIERPDVQRLVFDARDDKFDVVLFTQLSRLARRGHHFDVLMGRLVDICKKRVIGVEDGVDSQKEGNEFVTRILSVVAEQVSKQISISSKRGKKQSALKGNFTGAFAPYGYKKTVREGKKMLIVDEEAAEVVRKIFDLYVNHKMGEKAIVNHLNSPDLSIPSPRQKGLWGLTTVQRILQNEAYSGRNVFCKFTTEEFYNKNTMDLLDLRKKLVRRKKSEWLMTETKTHEPLIGDDLFQRAQEIRQIRGGGSRGGRKRYVNVFAKMIFCKHCGSAMVTMAAKGQYRYLMCSRRRRMGENGCENDKWVPYYHVRDQIMGWISKGLREQIDIDTGTDAVIEYLRVREKSTKSGEKEAAILQREIKQNRDLLFGLRKQKMLGEIDDAQYRYEKERYEQAIVDLEGRVGKIQEEMEQEKDFSAERMKIRAAVEGIMNFDSDDEVEKVRITLTKLIKEITVDRDGNVDVYTLLSKQG
ncbi:recombinase family protein [Gorillibacterium sp. CAU 1737]|uniref:recombinase family protein n=1 Tax=Gorillibacterium sp. CAU 1737 TaxID=3140362 RepID=UPI0032605338